MLILAQLINIVNNNAINLRSNILLCELQNDAIRDQAEHLFREREATFDDNIIRYISAEGEEQRRIAREVLSAPPSFAETMIRVQEETSTQRECGEIK